MTIGKVPMWVLMGMVAVMTILAPQLPAEVAPTGEQAPSSVPQSVEEPPGLAAGVLPAGTVIPESAPSAEVEDEVSEVAVSGEPSGIVAGPVAQESVSSDPAAAGVVVR